VLTRDAIGTESSGSQFTSITVRNAHRIQASADSILGALSSIGETVDIVVASITRSSRRITLAQTDDFAVSCDRRNYQLRCMMEYRPEGYTRDASFSESVIVGIITALSTLPSTNLINSASNRVTGISSETTVDIRCTGFADE
jgi:hypothetical protein